MEKLRTQRRAFLWLFLGLAGTGCNRQDADRLARMGGKVGERAEAAVAGNNGKVLRGWQAVRLHMGEVAIDGRVAARIGWDKELRELALQVQASGAEVTLSGKVQNLEQKRRAVELAQSTSGVEKVVDKLEGP